MDILDILQYVKYAKHVALCHNISSYILGIFEHIGSISGFPDIERRLGEVLELDKKRKEEEAKAAKISKLVENASPGAVVRVHAFN